jgi:YhcH/YjgK/YiaL family protein
MICGKLEGWRSIAGIEGLEVGFEFLERTNLAALPLGKHAIQGDAVFALAMKAPSKAPEEARYEAHRDYIDIQYLVAGDETIGVAPLGQLRDATPYDAEKDILFFGTPPAALALRIPPGHFAVFFPEDGHQPMRSGGAPGELHKVVVKIKVSHWEASRKP